MIALALLGCADEPVTLTAVEWRLAWAWDDVEADEGGWTTTTADGHVVRVEAGRLGSAGTSLVGCDPLSQAMLERSMDHGPDLDPSAWTAGRWDDLASPEDFAADAIAVDGGVYCDGHYAVSVGDETWDGDAGDASFELAGTVTAPDGASWRFDAATSYSHGRIDGLSLDEADLDGPIVATVTVVRPLAALFAEADLHETDPEALGWSLLGGLMHQTTFEVHARAAQP